MLQLYQIELYNSTYLVVIHFRMRNITSKNQETMIDFYNFLCNLNVKTVI